MSQPKSTGGPLAGRDLAILGAGAVGAALAQALVRAGARCTIWSRDPEHARAAARGAGRGARALAELERALAHGGPVLLCASEAGLLPLARRAARAAGALPGTSERVALHTHGRFGNEPLAPLAARGWACGRLHPLVSLPPGASGLRAFRGAGFAIGGDAPAFRAAEELARGLGGRPFELDAEGAPLYHAAAALLAGGLAALFDLAREAAERVVVPREEAGRALAALAWSVQRNLAAGGAAAALSGPLARGAEELVGEHLRALAAHDPLAARAYALLGERALALAARRGSLAPRAAERLAEVLRSAAAEGT